MPLHDAQSLLAVLQQHDLLPQAALQDLLPLAEQFPAAADLARELVRRGLLTPFQANEINQGRAVRLVLGQYLLLERLGQGGMGEVFKARHRVLDRPVALKVIRPEFVKHADAVERFRRECRAAGRLSHPNIVTVHDAHQVGDVHFLAMEYLEGKDLGRLLKERGALPPGRGVRLRPPGGAGAAARPREGHGPPRREAGQPDAHAPAASSSCWTWAWPGCARNGRRRAGIPI